MGMWGVCLGKGGLEGLRYGWWVRVSLRGGFGDMGGLEGDWGVRGGILGYGETGRGCLGQCGCVALGKGGLWGVEAWLVGLFGGPRMGPGGSLRGFEGL